MDIIKRKNKLLVLSLVYPNKYNLQSGPFVHLLNKELVKLGYEIKVIYLHDVGYREWNAFDFDVNYVEKYECDGIDVFMQPYKVFMPQFLPRINFFNYKKRVMKIVDDHLLDFQPDLIIGHFSVFSGITAMYLSKKMNIPYFVIEHHSIFLKSMKKYLVRKTKETIINASLFTTVSNDLKKNIIYKTNVADDAIKVVANMVSPSYYYCPPPKTQDFTFISVGSLKRNKNNIVLVESFIKIFSADERVKLKIVGNGPDYDKINDIITSSEREHQIELLGSMNEEQLQQEYSNSHCLVSFSKYETFGIVFRESNMVGRPIISYRNKGVSENWNKNLGIILDSLNLSAIENSFRYMIKNYDDYDLIKISQHTKRLYSSQIIAGFYNNRINEVLNDDFKKIDKI